MKGFQQWFLIDMGDTIRYIHGGSGSSNQREAMGRWAHTFAALAREHQHETPTLLFEYDTHNRLRFVEHFETFRAIGRELTGNYPSNRERNG